MAGVQIRFMGGPKDGRYENWAMQGGRPPMVIEVIEMLSTPVSAYWIIDDDPPVQTHYTRHVYHRMGKRDRCGAELYATQEIREGLLRGLSFAALGIMPVALAQEAVLIGGSSHGEIVTVPSPLMASVCVPIPGSLDTNIAVSQGFAEPLMDTYDNLNICSIRGQWIYLFHEYMSYVVAGRVPEIPDINVDIQYLISIAASRHAALRAGELPPVTAGQLSARRSGQLPDDELWTNPAGGRGDPLAEVPTAKPWTGWNLITEIDEMLGDSADAGKSDAE